ncbi:hypothetical protein HYV80_07675 [Candidatus Woesearchaeota archaeon]|nr:hypothetical protein [Candidatus Woesearchaeota archaeon]
MQTVSEGSIRLKAPKTDKISKEMGVFYNPVMSLNRDISVLLLNSTNKNKLQIADPLAATGVRSIRMLKELSKNKIQKIYINDFDKKSVELIKQNLRLNKIQHKGNPKISISNKDASLFLLGSSGFDYIDIDPFGTPNQFLDAACRRIARDGILAVTATDTSALCGTFPNACLRKYWALPKKGTIMHETGLRILIRKIQLIGAQYGKALTPIFSYSKEHYMRVFLRNEKGKSRVDEILKLHQMFNGAGPMWAGRLWDAELAGKMHSSASKNKIFKNNRELAKLLKIIKEESKINSLGFHDLHNISEKLKISSIQKKESAIGQIRKSGHKASETHFKGEGIRSGIPAEKLAKLLQKQLKNK